MKSLLLKFAFLFIATSCICGMCSKGDESGSDDNNNNNNNPNNPVLKPEDTWLYLEDAPTLVHFYEGNKRPVGQNWIATKISAAFSGVNSSTGKRYLSWGFENTGNTRFLSNTLNPSGKESISVFINEIATTPGPGSYTLDGDFKQGFCWYNVYTSTGALHDSTRHQEFLTNSSFNISKMTFFQSMASNTDRYKMSGDAAFHIMYWQNGTSSTTDIHTIQCHFNNVFIDFMK